MAIYLPPFCETTLCDRPDFSYKVNTPWRLHCFPARMKSMKDRGTAFAMTSLQFETAMPNSDRTFNSLPLVIVGLLAGFNCQAQIDPEHRNLLELGYDQPLAGQGPQGVYAYYYYNNPDFFKTNTALRLAIAPAYVDGEVGFKHLLSPTTDVGLGFNGGMFGANYYEVRQGDYVKSESFNG